MERAAHKKTKLIGTTDLQISNKFKIIEQFILALAAFPSEVQRKSEYQMCLNNSRITYSLYFP
jgi:hypothetical protein